MSLSAEIALHSHLISFIGLEQGLLVVTTLIFGGMLTSAFNWRLCHFWFLVIDLDPSTSNWLYYSAGFLYPFFFLLVPYTCAKTLSGFYHHPDWSGIICFWDEWTSVLVYMKKDIFPVAFLVTGRLLRCLRSANLNGSTSYLEVSIFSIVIIPQPWNLYHLHTLINVCMTKKDTLGFNLYTSCSLFPIF